MQKDGYALSPLDSTISVFWFCKIQINKCVWGWWVQFQGYSREKPLCSEQRESDEDLRCAESYRGLDGLSEEINQ